jgi:hypothetical protein
MILQPPERLTQGEGGGFPYVLARKQRFTCSVKRVIQTSVNGVVFEKRRSFWFYLAKQRFLGILDSGSGFPVEAQIPQLLSVEDCFDAWRSSYSNRFVCLSKGLKNIYIRQYSRFDSDYRSFLRSKLRMLDFMIWDLKIELTIDPKNFWHLNSEFRLLLKGWNRLRSWLRRRYGDFEFLRVLEIQKSGRPHLHVLISGINYVPQEDLSKIWQKYGLGEVVYIRSVYNRENVRATAYVLKYVNKTLRNSEKRYSALLFSSNKRVFGISRGCQNMIHVDRGDREHGYVYCGSVSESDLVAFCDEKGIELKPFLVVVHDPSDPYEFPKLFGMDPGG